MADNERDSGKKIVSAKGDGEVALKWWQLVTFVVTFAVGFGEARMSIANMSRDIEALSNAVRSHVELPGHPLEVERMNRLRVDLDASGEASRQILEKLSKIEANQIRLCQKQGVVCRE